MARKSRKNLDAQCHDTLATDVAEPESVQYIAAAYVRLSSDDRKKRGDSLETQQNIIENYVATEPDIRLVDVYSDNKATGTNFERPSFRRMLSDAENGRINCIIVKDLTRFGRNAIDTGYYLEKYLPSLGIRFIAVTDGYDSIDGDSGLLLPLKNIISESYALDISRKCRAVQRQNIAEGRFVGRLAPYGYRKMPGDCHRLIIDEETAPVVRRIFAWAAAGVARSEIARRLIAERTPPPCRHNFARGYNVSERLYGSEYWTPTTIREILTNRVYVGDMVQGKTRKEGGKQVFIAPAEWTCVPNTHEPIVSRERFEKVQRILQAAHDNAAAIQTTPYSENIFRGKVICARCGYTMRRKRQNKDGNYWFRCDSQWKYGKDACTVVSVKEADLKNEIISILCKHAEVIFGRYIHMERSVSSDTTADELREINRNLDKDGRMLRSLYESLIGELITRDEFAAMKAAYQAKIEILSRQADEIRNRRYQAKARAANYSRKADAVSEVLCEDHLTANHIDMLIREIRVHPSKSFDIHFSFADEFGEGYSIG